MSQPLPTAAGLSIPGTVPTAYRGWIQSPAFDLACFTLSPLVGLIIALAAIAHPSGFKLGIAASFILGVPHYLATFTFYLGDENRAHYFGRPLAFIAAPLVIFATVLGLRLVHLDQPVIITMFVWNIWHVSLQSAGILAIYRRLHGGADDEKTVAKVALFSTAGAMSFWLPTTFPPIYNLMESWFHGAYRLLSIGFGTVAAVALVLLTVRIARRSRRVSFAEGTFLFSSILLFHPFLWIADGLQSTLAMLSGHFIQYLAIVWLLNQRKYGSAPGSTVQRLMGNVSSRPLLVYVVIVGTGVTAWLMSRVAAAAGVPMAYVIGLNSLALIHFYLDGRIWAFRQPFVRQTIGQTLIPAERRIQL